MSANILGPIPEIKAALDKAAEQAFEAYHATVRDGSANAKLSWNHYITDQLRSAYYLYADTYEEMK